MIISWSCLYLILCYLWFSWVFLIDFNLSISIIRSFYFSSSTSCVWILPFYLSYLYLIVTTLAYMIILLKSLTSSLFSFLISLALARIYSLFLAFYFYYSFNGTFLFFSSVILNILYFLATAAASYFSFCSS